MSLIIRSINYVHADNEELFHDLNFTVENGKKAALVGINGAGKSTLLRIIAGRLSATSGEIISTERPWYVPQHLGEYDHHTIAQALGVDKKINALQAILRGDIDLRYFTDLDEDWEIEDKVKKVLVKWGLSNFGLDQLLGSLSGGQKTKVFLAALDIHCPGIILLDEPSNHLDAAARKKLYTLIAQSKATMLIVSHDKALLNLMNRTLELSKKGVEVFGGNFEFYQQEKEKKVNALKARLNEKSKTLKQFENKARDMVAQRRRQEASGRSTGLSHSIPRIIAGGLKNKAERSTAKLLDAHTEKLSNLEEDIGETRAQIQQYSVLKIDIRDSGLHPGKVLVSADQINFSYNDKPLWNGVSFQMISGNRVQINGENGAGKTTLLKIITHQLQPQGGSFISAQFSYLYLDQDYTIINPNLNIYEQVQEYNSGKLEEHELKSLLTHYQFEHDAFDRKCEGLSGGEKMKLSLCCLEVGNCAPDMLILDEPTNNLDVKSLEVLTLAVKAFGGTLLVISHDEYFVKEIGLDSKIDLS